MTEWKAVIGWEGLYEVSDAGAVRSVDRVVVRGDGSRQSFRGQPLRQRLHDHGYCLVRLSAPARREVARVHRLVALAFIPQPTDCQEVNHRDGVKTHNRVENLEWTTPYGNRKHAWDTGLRTRAHLPIKRGATNGQAKLTDALVREMRARRDQGVSFGKLALAFGVNKRTVQHIVAGRAWKHVPLPAPPTQETP